MKKHVLKKREHVGILKILILLSAAFILTPWMTSREALADNDSAFVLDTGLGIFNTQGDSVSQVKLLKFGYEETLWSNVKNRYNAGAWLDTRGNGYNSSAFIDYQLGFDVNNKVFDMSIWTGPALITSPDAELGGMFQFNETLFFGIIDRDKNTIGVSYNHFSSAGLEFPNQGKDFLSFGIRASF
jgi:hypothetical protein